MVTLKAVVPILILAVAGITGWWLHSSQGPVEQRPPSSREPIVRTVTVAHESVPLDVEAQGTVLPRTETTMVAQVAGQIVATSPYFEVGGLVDAGEVLVELDSRDYELEVERARAAVAEAEVVLERENAEAVIALEEWERLGDGEPPGILVTREPQIKAAAAALRAAQAALEQTELALERTRIVAPFDGRIRTKTVGVGQYLSEGAIIAVVQAIDYAEVRLPVRDATLAFLDIPFVQRNGETLRGPEVELSTEFAGARQSWIGQIVRTDGEVDLESRMVNLVARVDEPYETDPPLAVGLFVDAHIHGQVLERAVVLPSAALSENGEHVWLVDPESRLRRRPVDVIRNLGDEVVIGGGLEVGDRVCVSLLSLAVDGMAVQIVDLGSSHRHDTMTPTVDTETPVPVP
ncbi:MAG: efflux RND transporter periplasmic adaptor subunit [Acidobacteriota bacterium]